MAYAARTYPVVCDVEATRLIKLGAVDVYYGQQLMHDDDDTPAGSAILCVTGDASDRFAGIALETVLNASDALGTAGEVYIEVMRKGTYIAELDTTPTLDHLGAQVFADGDNDKVSPTAGTGFAVGIVEEWENVGDPLARTNAVKVRINVGGIAFDQG